LAFARAEAPLRPAAADQVEPLIGRSAALRLLDEQVEQAARSGSKVLITGESGVGKEIVARQIHRRSLRSRLPLLVLNCAGVPDSLLESELFGHVRGSFTDAHRDRPGLLELAHRGTVFLDEIGETSMRMQALLLRVLETGEIQRIGSDRLDARVDVRIIAATNRNLQEAVEAGQFREDLFFRLNVLQIAVPPLRDRREDVHDLLQHFLMAYARVHRVPVPELSAEALALLVEYPWPGNIRELRNVVERLTVRPRSDGTIRPADLPPEIAGAAAEPDGPAPESQLVALAPIPSTVDRLFERLVRAGEPFWSAVYEPFMSRDLTREEVRQIVARGLAHTTGSYRTLVQLFNLEASEYKRFLNFLRKHDCHVPYQPFRAADRSAAMSE
jgi:two-component system, NtrC family, response regulator AtoC